MIQYKDILYIKDQLNKIRYWCIFTDNNKYHIEFGVFNTDDPIKINCIINEGKNIGKSNETTPEQQCLKEVESIYKDKHKKGYKSCKDLNLIEHALLPTSLYNELNELLSKDRTDLNNCYKPMKAQKYETGCMSFPCLIQPKINGVRATISNYFKVSELFSDTKYTRILSKEGNEYIIHHLSAFLHDLENNIVLDGELYIPHKEVTTIGGAARNTSNEYHESLSYMLFDLAIPNISQIERYNMLNNITLKHITTYNIDDFCTLNKTKRLPIGIHLVPSIMCMNENDIIKWTKLFIESGFEGGIIRDIHADYRFGQRPKTMRKLKYFQDAEFIILDIFLSEKGQVIFKCKNDLNDLTFNVDGVKEFLEMNMIKDKQLYIGKPATVQFYERTINQLPFHTTLVAIRDYE